MPVNETGDLYIGCIVTQVKKYIVLLQEITLFFIVNLLKTRLMIYLKYNVSLAGESCILWVDAKYATSLS